MAGRIAQAGPAAPGAGKRGRARNQGLRDQAAIAVLLGSGLRVSELLGLRRQQYTGRGFQNVLIKGGRIREFVPVQSHARQVLAEWLKAGGRQSGFIFTTRSGKSVTRSQMPV
ncbi:MAG: tyrosine-type recombinase/integrase [Candidatus Binatia bacterium]